MEEDDDLTGEYGQSDGLNIHITRFEEMIRNKDRYFFDVDALIRANMPRLLRSLPMPPAFIRIRQKFC